jgi:acetoin utilization deacetylase AcuC-like enzyme
MKIMRVVLGKRRRRGLGILIILFLMGGFWIQCSRPISSKLVKSPRAGQTDTAVAVVYSDQYLIRLAGLEKLHPHPQPYAKAYTKLVTEGWLAPTDVWVPTQATEAQIRNAHSEAFIHSLKSAKSIARYVELPMLAIMPVALLDSAILAPFRTHVGGTLLASRLAMEHGVAINIGGGYHHAFRDRGEGFCIYNDLAIAIRTLQAEGVIKRALVVDLDVHQGNGTAGIFAGDDSVYTFSMHQGDIYPIPKTRSDSDIDLPGGTTDAEYLKLLRNAMPRLLAAANPDLVLLQGGGDVLAGDSLGGLAMTPEGLIARDAIVIDACVEAGIPIATTFGGGYSDQAWQAVTQSMIRTLRTHGPTHPPHPARKPSLLERKIMK